MSGDLSHGSAEALGCVCRRHGVVELSVFGSSSAPEPPCEPALNLLACFRSGVEVSFSDLMDIQEDLAAVLHRRVFLVPRTGLGSRGAAGSELQVIYRARPE